MQFDDKIKLDALKSEVKGTSNKSKYKREW